VVGRAELGGQIRLGTALHHVEDVDVEAALRAEQRPEQAQRSRSRDQHAARSEMRAPAYPLDVLPGLGDHAGRLGEHTQATEPRVGLDRESLLDSEPLRHEPVAALDAPFGVQAVAAHVPLTYRAVRARDRIGAPNYADDQVAGSEPASRGRFKHASQRLVAEHQPVAPRRRFPVLALDYLVVGPVDPDGDRVAEDLSPLGTGLGDLDELRRHRGGRPDGERTHR